MGYLFTKGFYRDGNWNEVSSLEGGQIRQKTREIKGVRPFTGEDGTALRKLCDPGASCQGFQLYVAYPGVYVGIGYEHGLNDRVSGEREENDPELSDYKNGFSFDHTTGLPCIPGSLVKGMLRMCFAEYPEETLECLKPEIKDRKALGQLERRLFGARIEDRESSEGCVVFFDVFPDVDQGSDGCIVGDDYITPHREWFAEPNPIRMLKILPGVKLKFRFLIPETIALDGCEIGREKIVTVFRELLTLFGVGAKTGVGYGVLSDEPIKPNRTGAATGGNSVNHSARNGGAAEGARSAGERVTATSAGLFLMPGTEVRGAIKRIEKRGSRKKACVEIPGQTKQGEAEIREDMKIGQRVKATVMRVGATIELKDVRPI